MPRCFAALALAFVVLACGPRPDVDAGRDAGREDGPLPLGARAEVSLPRERVALGDVTIRSFDVRVASVRLVSDRGEPFDPVRSDVGVLPIALPSLIELPSIAPATYSAVVIVLDGAGPVLDLDVDDATLGRVHVTATTRQDWNARCGSPIAVAAFDLLRVGVTAELQDAWTALREAALPAPVGGVIEVNEVSAPGVTQDFLRDVRDLLRAECDVDDDG